MLTLAALYYHPDLDVVPARWQVAEAGKITAGKRGYRLARAGHLAEAAYLDIATASWQVRSRLRTALLDLYLNRESAAILRTATGGANRAGSD